MCNHSKHPSQASFSKDEGPLKSKRRLLLPSALMASIVGAGCAHYDLDQSYRDEFGSLIRNYQSEAQRIALHDRTLQQQETGDPLPDINLDGDPILSAPVRVQESLPSRDITLEDFYVRALENSSQIRVFSELPLIRETGIQEARGAFDTRLFVEARYDERNDPVGSSLTTGRTSGRFTETEYGVQAGVRKKVATGGEVYLTQELSRVKNNSDFFLPNPQSRAVLRLGFIQPLLKGAGVAYNRSIIQIAEIDSDIARHEFLRQAESHLLEITRTYWTLYMARGIYQAKQRSYNEALTTVEQLESRDDFDTVRRQILRARAAQSERRADLVRAESAVRNAEDRLKALVNDPEFLQLGSIEIIPADLPVIAESNVNLKDVATAALENRPEILQSFLQLRAAAVREKMQKNELLPVLNLIVEGYLSGLDRGDNIGGAWDHQFSQGKPGAAIGLRFEFPVENNEADARYLRRRLEMRQLVEQLRTTMETVLLEVRVSVREVRTAYRDLKAKHASLLAAREDLDDYERRREVILLGAESSAIGYLEFLIEAQERRAVAEERFLQALATYNVALVSLERAKGNLLNYQSIEVQREWDDEQELPRLRLNRETETAEETVSAEVETASTTHP